MSNERGNEMLVGVVHTRLGATPTVQQVVDYLMDSGTITNDRARAHVARAMFCREWVDAIGKEDMWSVCTRIATKLDLEPDTIYRHARLVIKHKWTHVPR